MCTLCLVLLARVPCRVNYKGQRQQAFADKFEDVFRNLDPDHEGLKLFNDGQVGSLEDVENAADKIGELLSDGVIPAYATLANLAHLFAVYEKEDEALTFARLCDQHYSLVAAPEQLLLGDLAASREGENEAVQWYEKARATAPSYGPTHVKAAEVYLLNAWYGDYARVMIDYAKVTDEPLWEHLKWMTNEAIGDEPGSVPEDVRLEFQQICQSEFGSRPDQS